MASIRLTAGRTPETQFGTGADDPLGRSTPGATRGAVVGSRRGRPSRPENPGRPGIGQVNSLAPDAGRGATTADLSTGRAGGGLNPGEGCAVGLKDASRRCRLMLPEPRMPPSAAVDASSGGASGRSSRMQRSRAAAVMQASKSSSFRRASSSPSNRTPLNRTQR